MKKRRRRLLALVTKLAPKKKSKTKVVKVKGNETPPAPPQE